MRTLFAGICLLVFLMGCAHIVSIQPTDFQGDIASRYPIKVACILPDDYFYKDVRVPMPEGSQAIFFPYRDFHESLNAVLKQMFLDEISIYNFEDIANYPDVLLVFDPSIKFETGRDSVGFWSPTWFKVELKTVIYDRDMVKLSEATGEGDGVATMEEVAYDMGVAGKRAMETAMNNMLKNLDYNLIAEIAKTEDVKKSRVQEKERRTRPERQKSEEAYRTEIPYATPVVGKSERFAVIIGISTYRDSRIPGLRYAAADAAAFYNWIVSPDGGRYSPARVKLLINEAATGKSIKEALYVWLKQALAEDVVTIYFAGHGSPESPDAPENLYLLPYDAEYNSIASTGFPMWDIETALKRFVCAQKVVVIADACHAGGVGQAFDIATRSGRAIRPNPISVRLQNLSKIADGVAVISASDDRQLSQESREWGGGHGVFTYYLLMGLEGEADYNKDGRTTLGELIPYLSQEVRRATQNHQSPTVAGKFDPALAVGR